MSRYLTMLLLFFFSSTLFCQNNKDKKAELIQHLKDSEEFLYQMLADITPTTWSYKNTEAAWSVGNCAEHILLAEKNLLVSAQKKLSTETPTPKESPQTDETVLNIVYDRINKKVKTIEPFEPKNEWKNKVSFLAAHRAFRKELYQFLETNKKNLDHYFTSSPAGEISLYQSFLVLGAHTARHTNQIEEIKYQLGLNTSKVSFGGNVKVNVPFSKRTAIQQLFGEVLLLKIDEQKNYDRVLFDDDGFVAFVYHTDDAMILSEADFAKSMQAGLLVPSASYESIKRRLIAFGVKPYQPPYKVNLHKHFYFHVPGGQVFRLVRR